MKKKITTQQHGDAIKLMQATSDATNKYLAIPTSR